MFTRRILFLCCAAAPAALAAHAQGPATVDEAVAKLTADVDAGKKIDAKAFAKKWIDLDDVMKAAYKPGKKTNLEGVLSKLAAKASYTAADRATLEKVAKLSRGLAAVTAHYDEKTKGNAAKKRDWDQYTKDMGSGAKELLDALRGGNRQATKKAATKLTASCNDCHSAFR
jgi:hypothetical protein